MHAWCMMMNNSLGICRYEWALKGFPPTSSTVKCAYAAISLSGLHVRGVAMIELMGHLQIYSTYDTSQHMLHLFH